VRLGTSIAGSSGSESTPPDFTIFNEKYRFPISKVNYPSLGLSQFRNKIGIKGF
jgi:hypothetical protein